MVQQRVLQEVVERAEDYPYPLATTLITATTSGAAHVIGTVREATLGQLVQFFASNQTGTAATLSFHAVPEGGTIGAANREISELEIPANTNVALHEVVAGLYDAGTTLEVYAGTTNAILVGGYIKGVL